MAAPIVYRWDDANAPVARGERRSLCDILYACLVTGYGVKPGAGWTREFVNATFDKAVFRPASGTRFYLQVDGVTSGANTPIIKGFESMTDVDSGLFPFYSVANKTQLISDSANTTARPWVLIADDKAFWFTTFPDITVAPINTSVMNATMFFGDIVKFNSEDAYACALMTSQSGYGAYVIGVAAPSEGVGTDIYFPRKSTGVAGSAYMTPQVRGGGPADAPGAQNSGSTYVEGGPLFISRPYVNDGAAWTFRGWLPGLYAPCHNMPFDQLATVTKDGRSWLSFRGYTNGSSIFSNWLISLEDWRA